MNLRISASRLHDYYFSNFYATEMFEAEVTIRENDMVIMFDEDENTTTTIPNTPANLSGVISPFELRIPISERIVDLPIMPNATIGFVKESVRFNADKSTAYRTVSVSVDNSPYWRIDVLGWKYKDGEVISQNVAPKYVLQLLEFPRETKYSEEADNGDYNFINYDETFDLVKFDEVFLAVSDTKVFCINKEKWCSLNGFESDYLD